MRCAFCAAEIRDAARRALATFAAKEDVIGTSWAEFVLREVRAG